MYDAGDIQIVQQTALTTRPPRLCATKMLVPLLLFSSSDTVDLVYKVPCDYFNVVYCVCKDEVGIVSKRQDSCLNVLLRKKLGQAISKPNSPRKALKRLSSKQQTAGLHILPYKGESPTLRLYSRITYYVYITRTLDWMERCLQARC